MAVAINHSAFGEKLTTWLLSRDKQVCHRQLLLISGCKAFCEQQLAFITAHFNNRTIHASGCVLNTVPEALALKQTTQLLGSTCSLAIYDAFDAFRPSALLALAGTVSGNGLLVICTPDLKDWPEYKELTTNHYLSFGHDCTFSAFRNYVATEFRDNESIALLQENGICRLPPPLPVTNPEPGELLTPFASLDQQATFAAMSSLSGDGVSLLTADRGRGKSTLLGMLAAHWLLSGNSVSICSRYPDSVSAIFEGIKLIAPHLEVATDRSVAYGEHAISWLPIDHPHLMNNTAAILIIDEAANLPIPALKLLCTHFSRVVLSTTMRGYEGTGRGFLTRFIPWLHTTFAKVNYYSAITPVRWSEHDPVEALLNTLFQLTSAPVEELVRPKIPGKTQSISTNELCFSEVTDKSPEAFASVISLLMTAHYQTTVDELVRLCDTPENHTLVARLHGRVVGVLNIQFEGGKLLQSLAQDIASGTRRLNGHLSAQSISHFIASADIASYRYCRVNRIAVEPEYQRKGIATYLLNSLVKWLEPFEVDAITTSFGATPELIGFWRTCHFEPVKAGLKRDASSAEYSLLMWQPVSGNATALAPLVAARFTQELMLHHERHIFNLPEHLHSDTNSSNSAQATAFTNCNMAILQQVISKQRHIQHARGSLVWLLNRYNTLNCTQDSALSQAVAVLTNFALYFDDLPTFISHYHLTGKKQAYDFATAKLIEVMEWDNEGFHQRLRH